jgi:iron complex transport system ATP-binding protein
MLRATALAIGHPGRRVGEGFELALQPGRVLALLGPNGAGKTTLLRTLLGLIPPQGGRLELEGRPLHAFSPGERAKRLAYVPQDHAGAFAFTVDDWVLMGRTAHASGLGRPSAQDRAAVAAALARMGIAALADRPVTQLSGGERQLALIARALAQQARLLVLDEPTASLDFGHQGRVMRELRRLAADGLGVLFTTHDPNHARRFADDALLIRDGRTLASGPVATVIDRAQLERLYGAPVEQVGAPGADGQAFLPA